MTNLLNLGVIALFTYQKQAQAQEDIFSPLPGWMWIGVILLVIIIGVIWVLREEENNPKRPRPAAIPKPVSRPAPPAPVTEESVAPAKEPQPVAPTPIEETSSAAAKKPAPKPDDLRQVSGIGPKIMQILNENGIHTFEQLAATDISFLEKLMEEQGWRMANFATWPEQARVLAAEKKGKA